MNISKLSKQQTIHSIGSRYDRKKLENLEEKNHNHNQLDKVL